MLELFDRLAEIADFLALIFEEKRDELEQVFGVRHRAAKNFLPILDQDRRA
ncbi:hypothetical protein NKH99_17890 [Mesorhizobium sp. M0854]|uniref:hypothetical protein n=1 Tax=Mesorhizobium sp. M0854 TaxID=2957013 RepID=UPI0033364832